MSTRASATPAKRRILIVDDHPLFRDGARMWIDRQTDLTCCGEADSVASAHHAITTHKPDLVLLALSLGTENGLQLIKSLRTRFPHLPVLVISGNEEMVFGDLVLRAGAQGYLMKREPATELLSALRAVLAGEVHVSQKLAAVLLKKLWHGDSSGDATTRLSDRERQVFQMLGSGIGTREIARKLNLGIKTIETHREHIKKKLGLKSATSLMHAATTWMHTHSLPPPPLP